jgi:excisionase family DNA binding protein
MTYKPREAAEILGLCRTTVLRYIQRGEIKAQKYGKKIMIDETEIESFKESHTTGTTKN